MKSITIQLTEQQEHFLKLFAANHFPGAKDNLCTNRPIHIVQTQNERVIDPDYDTEDAVKYVVPEWAEDFDSAEELIRAKYENEDYPIEIVSFEEAYSRKEFIDINGEKLIIFTEKDYFEAYGIEDDFYDKVSIEKYYKDVAFFFILSEAKRYIEYQKHNLNNPRTYSYGPGYANNGEYEHFYDLLLKIGTVLNENREEVQ